MNALDNFKFKKTWLWIFSMVFSFTGYMTVLIFIRKKKFYHYAVWMYEGNFRDNAWVLKIYNQYYQTEVYTLYWWIPVCLVLDIVLRRLVLPSIKKPQSTV